MARFKPVNPHQSKMPPVRFADRVWLTGEWLNALSSLAKRLPGTFEYAGHWLVDHEIDLSVFNTRYRNAPAGAICSIVRRVLPWCYQTRSPRNVHDLAEIA